MKVTYANIDPNFRITEDIHEHILKRARKIESRYKGVREINVVLRPEGHLFHSEMVAAAPGATFYATTDTEGPIAALDSVTEKIISQMRKYKDRIKDRRKNASHREVVEKLHGDYIETVLDTEEPDSPVIIAKPKKFAIKPMTLDEGRIELENSGAPFLLFLNAETREVNLLYEIDEKTYGWVEPLFT